MSPPNPLLADYLASLSNSYRRQLGTVLRKWCAFLEVVGIRRTPDLLRTNPTAWDFVTADLLYQYRQMLLHKAYLNTTVNRHLTILRAFIHAVYRAGGIPDKAEVEHIVGTRRYPVRSGIPSPYSLHSASPDAVLKVGTRLSPAQVDLLKHRHSDTPQGWRDTLLMCLLLDHRLCVNTLATLKAQDFDLLQGILRPSNLREDEEQLYHLSPDTLHAVQTYLATDASLRSGVLFRAIKKNGALSKVAMAPRHIAARVRIVGKQILGIATLRPQDCRQY